MDTTTTLTEQPKLTQEEWSLVIELLRRELRDLPAEIHHTRTTGVREQLRRRLEMIEGLLLRIPPM